MNKSVLNSTVPTPSDDSALIIPLVFIVAFALIIVLSLVLLGILVKLRKHGPQHQSDNESHEQCNGHVRPSKRRRFRFFSPQKLLGKYPTTRSVEEMDIKKDPNDFKAASLQRCHSMPSVVVTDTMAHSNSQSFGQAGSLIDKVSCCHYLIPQDSEFPAHKYLTLEKTPKALLTSTSSFEEFSEAETVIEESQMVTRGYANVKVPKYSVSSDEGFTVPTQDMRTSLNTSMCENFKMQHKYNKLNFFEESSTFWIPASTIPSLYVQLAAKKYREIPVDQVRVLGKLGAGNFASVSKATWTMSSSGRTKSVAVKILKSDSTEQDKVKFLQEAAIMGQFQHPNIIKLHGVVTVCEPTMIVLELMRGGDLKTHLRRIMKTIHLRKQEALKRRLLHFAKDIASGMKYLEQMSFVHRDLAARNVLVAKDLTCKIGDFGMARDLLDKDYYKSKGGTIPIKWTAPEAIVYCKYTTASDVWSYGMVLFELWSLGKTPYSDLTNRDVVVLSRTGLCQIPPPGCSRPLYLLMVDCWNPDPSKRPSFTSICNYLNMSDDFLLHSSEEDKPVSPQASLLGASLNESKHLYRDLQLLYKQHGLCV